MNTKSQIMKAAWALSAVAAKRFGGNKKDFFVASLKKVYELLRDGIVAELFNDNYLENAVISVTVKTNKLNKLLLNMVNKSIFIGCFKAGKAINCVKEAVNGEVTVRLCLSGRFNDKKDLDKNIALFDALFA
jgi:hypothetical protein